jgi:hypothetical protein
MSLSSLWIFIRTVIVVTIVTGLVWLYAEGESLKSYSVEADVSFVAPNANLQIKPDSARRVRITVKCSTSKKAELDRLLVAMPAGGIRLDLGDRGDAPNWHVSASLRERLAKQFDKIGGIVIESTQPETLEVDVERLVPITLPVRIESGDIVLAAASTVDPQTVALSVPAAVVARLDSAFVEARLDLSKLANLPPEPSHTQQVPITVPEQWKRLGVTLPPTIAKVTFSIRKQTETFVIKTIPINLSGPPTSLAKYVVVFDDEQRLLRDVTVTGPHDTIEKIKQDPKLVRADLCLTADELEKNEGKGPVKGTLSITAPANVTFDPPALVTYTVVAK